MTTYLIDDEGKFIPATQRPDGTWRKARRVKEGYVPQEEVPLYESKGKQFANWKSNLPVGMCPVVEVAAKKETRTKNKQSTPGIIVLPKNIVTTTPTTPNTTSEMVPTTTSGSSSSTTNATLTINKPTESEIEIETITKDLTNIELENMELAKKLKKLRKKIREIETIQEKLKSGELKKPEKDQMEKVKRKKEILKEIKAIEAQIEE